MIALVFGLFEGGMPLVGLLLGRQLSGGPAACSPGRSPGCQARNSSAIPANCWRAPC
ncbi:MAG TPA: hypothetical protein VGG16_11840 [Streptosporangiaceae bacterium]